MEASARAPTVGGIGGRDGSGGGQEQEEARQGREMAAAQGEERS